MKLREMTFLTCFCLLAVEVSLGQKAPAEGVVLPGQSVAGVELGATLASFLGVFPKHEGTDEKLPVNDCGVGSYHWVDVDRGATGIYAYTKDGTITQFSVKTPRLSLPNGIKVESSETEVRQAYPQGKAYVLLRSNSAVMGGRNLVYWVDEQDGIAFELYWNKKKSQRLVSGIDIFKRSATYLPDGCISAPQRLKAAGQPWKLGDRL